MSVKIHCGDCSTEKDCEWCEICSSWLCEDCDPTHDCLDADLEVALDEMLDYPEDDGDGHA